MTATSRTRYDAGDRVRITAGKPTGHFAVVNRDWQQYDGLVSVTLDEQVAGLVLGVDGSESELASRIWCIDPDNLEIA